MSLGKRLVGMSLGETGVGGLGIGAGKALEVVCEGAFENGLGMSLTKHLRMVWERTLGKHMRVVWEREDMHQFHVNKLIRLASLCDSSHKIIHSVLCQTVHFSESFQNKLLLIAQDLLDIGGLKGGSHG